MIEDLYETLFDNIRLIVRLEGLAIGELEKKIGVSAGYISRMHRKGSTLGIEKLYKLSKITGYSMDDLCSKQLKIRLLQAEINKLQGEMQEEEK